MKTFAGRESFMMSVCEKKNKMMKTFKLKFNRKDSFLPSTKKKNKATFKNHAKIICFAEK